MTLEPGEPLTPRVTVVTANRASWDDLQAVFGTRGYAARCQCQRFKIGHVDWSSGARGERGTRLREETACGHPRAGKTSGLVAYLSGEPVGWCAVEPRVAYRRLLRMRGWRKGRDEDPADDSVWAITCFITRAGYRRRGITYALAAAAVDFALKRGAQAIEGYPMITRPDQDITWGELHVGSRNVFADVGFVEVSRPSLRPVVMRIDFDGRRPVSAAADQLKSNEEHDG
jgi:GNAT superfamily N-acetyltransferase